MPSKHPSPKSHKRDDDFLALLCFALAPLVFIVVGGLWLISRGNDYARICGESEEVQMTVKTASVVASTGAGGVLDYRCVVELQDEDDDTYWAGYSMFG
eukprot:g8718.t1